ncbi:MAG: ABC transporter ATP-binding protein [Thiotrichales bacterium]
MSSDRPILHVEGLRTYLRSGEEIVKAVDDVSFSIERGQTYCLVGESGSGKSITALSIIQLLPALVASHPGGQIFFDYKDPRGRHHLLDMLTQRESRLREIRGSKIAMIFQEPMTSLNPVFTVGEQIIEALMLHHNNLSLAQAREKALIALQQVQLKDAEKRMDEYPHRLSGGQRQRVMIAMAIACEPDLLIADEPTTALDVTVQAEILSLMKNLQRSRQMSILFITHDFGVVAQMADQVGVMRSGRLVESGPVDAVLYSPQHSYTKTLLGSLPENLPPREKVEHTVTEKPLVSVKQLKVYFPIKKGVFRHTVDHVKAVDGVSLDILPGEIVALVGESGCGKSTLGRAILRLLEPTDGQVFYSGSLISELPLNAIKPYRRGMQIIFQDPMSSLNPRLTIATTLIEPMRAHGIGKSHQDRIARAEEVLNQVKLPTDFLWRYPHELSGGQRQRVGIARALVLDPKFIVCDEVTSALDVSVQAEVLQLLLELREERNLSLLFITHNIGVVEYLSDRMFVMNQGRIVEHGETATVCSAPANPYTRQLLSAVPRLEHHLA